MRAVIVVLLALASPAHADRSRAEQLEREARDAADPEKYVACGQAYLEIYNQDPAAPHIDETLYNAAVCFEEGKSIGAAMQAIHLIRKYAPRSRLQPRAIARLGHLYARIAQYDEAAGLYEEYARKYAGEKDAYHALSEASYFRAALGDDAKLVANVRFFLKMFGAKQLRDAAAAHWMLVPAMERRGPDAAIAHLREHLRLFARTVDPERNIVAHAKLGELLWQRACPAATIDGLCQKLARPGRVTWCGPGELVSVVTVARDPRLVKDALAELAAAVKTFERTRGEGAAGHAAGKARVLLADAELESFLAIQFPTGLDFDPRRERVRAVSLKRWQQYIEDKQRLGAKARRSYENVLGSKEPRASIAASARLGQLTQAFAHQILTAEIPRGVRTGPNAKDKTSAFCTPLVEASAPMQAHASHAFDICAAKASELGVLDDFTHLCHRERDRLDPGNALPERFARPGPGTVAIPAEPPLR